MPPDASKQSTHGRFCVSWSPLEAECHSLANRTMSTEGLLSRAFLRSLRASQSPLPTAVMADSSHARQCLLSGSSSGTWHPAAGDVPVHSGQRYRLRRPKSPSGSVYGGSPTVRQLPRLTATRVVLTARVAGSRTTRLGGLASQSTNQPPSDCLSIEQLGIISRDGCCQGFPAIDRPTRGPA